MPQADTTRGLHWMLHLVVLFSVLGAIVGLGYASMVIITNQYVELGFWRTILELSRLYTWRGALLGAAIGCVGMGCFSAYLWRGRGKNRRRGDGDSDLRSGEARVLPAVICLGCASLVAATLSVAYIQQHNHGWEIWGPVALLWLLLFVVGSKKAMNSPNKSLLEIYGFLLTSFLVATMAIFGGLVLNFRYLPQMLSLQSLAGNALWCLACVAIVWVMRVARSIARGGQLPGSVLRPLVVVPYLVLGVCGIFWGVSLNVYSHAAQQARAKFRNVILIGIDTLRADHVNFIDTSDYRRDLTPNLRALAKRGTVFTSAISQAPWTLPAFASIMTGKYPPEHGAISMEGTPLRSSQTTLAEILREAGFVTQAVVSHEFVNSRHGFAQGFTGFNEDNDRGEQAIGSDNVTEAGLQFLQKHQRDRFFLFLHYFDPHHEYQDHPDYPYGDEYTTRIQNGFILLNLQAKRHLLQPSDIEFMVALYDGEIAHTDKAIGRILRYLQQHQLDQSTAVIVVADHGEEFMEHGSLGHLGSLYEELVRVPLFMVLPGFEHSKSVVDTVVETRSIFSTILAYLGIEHSQGTHPQSLLGLMRSSPTERHTAAGEQKAYTSVWLPDASQFSGNRVMLSALRTNPWKLIIDHYMGTQLLFNLVEDPQERMDRSKQEPETFREMKVLLDGWIEKMAQEAQKMTPRHKKRTPAMEERLKALGYL